MAEESINKPTARRTERIGKYEIIGHIATGGMGVIYKARDIGLDRLVALKILPPGLAAQQTTLIRFQREAKAAAQLRHENIVTLFDCDFDEASGTYFIALEYIEGTDLQDYISRKCRLDPDEARQIIIQAARALAHAHEHGIVHRDIKPSNFLLTRKGERLIVKLTDFGLAIRHESDAEFRITKDKTTVGTIDYMSPEQARDSRSADIRSDIYSLGCTFYHMLAGLAPFARGTLPERLIQHMKASPPDVRKLSKGVPDYLVAIINRMLAKKPDDRYQSPAELLHALENPEQVSAPGKREPAAGKLERGRPRKQPIDPTQVIDKKELDEDDAPPRQIKNSRMKKKASERIEEEPDEPAEEETPSETHDVPWEPDPDEAAPEEVDEPRKKSGTSSPLWMYVTGGSVGVLVFVLILVVSFGGRNPPSKKDPEKPPTPQQPIVIENPNGKTQKKEPPVVALDTSPAKMTVVLPDLPLMDTPLNPLDLSALRREYYGPFTAFPEAPAKSTVLRMNRLAAVGPNTFCTVADALAQAKAGEFTVIEIHDNGPIYLPLLTAAPERDLVLRGANGYRPLLVWETPKKAADPKALTAFFTLTGGKLILDNLDFVMQWSDQAPAAMFDLADTDFHARDCTFSVAGESKEGAGVALLRRHGATAENRLPKTWLQRCFVRGADLSLLRLHESSAAVLVEESLIVGYQHPLLDVRGRDQDSLEFYSVRSSLICGQTLLRCQPEGKGANPKIVGKVLDSILSRDDATTPQGDLLHVSGGADLAKLSWRGANSVYAGWKQLLTSDSKNIAGIDLKKWHSQWLYREGDRAILDTWPNDPPSGLAEQSASIFLPAQSPVAFAALSGEGSIGCVIGRLPAAPEAWIQRAFKQGTAPIVAAGDLIAPPIDKGDLYGGERIDLTKVPDIGKYLTDKLQKIKPAPRVVIHLAGKGAFETSRLQVKGVQTLVLFCDPKDSITFGANAFANADRKPLFDVADGNLELIGMRIRLNPDTLLPAILRVQEGNLSLTRCSLQGPHIRSVDSFQNLIVMNNAGPEPTTLLLRDTVLISSKLLIKLQDHVQLHARNNVFLALGDGVLFDVNSPSIPMKHVLDHNTWGVRQAVLTLKTGPEFQAAGQVTVHAKSNAFLHPFDGADKGTLLRGAEAWVARGGWTWRGEFNVYDSRMHAYFADSEPPAGPRQTHRDWQAAWGQTGEREQLLLSGATAKTISSDAATPVALLSQLDRLALPSELRGKLSERPPGADLVLLGIKKKG